MNDKKSLDRLFQEKFKDFESEPNEQVWKNIEAALKKDDDRKVIPFWWKLSGVAAVVLLGIFSWDYFSDGNSAQNSIVIEQGDKNSVGNASDKNPVVAVPTPKGAAKDPIAKPQKPNENLEENNHNPELNKVFIKTNSSENALATGSKSTPKKAAVSGAKTDSATENAVASASGKTIFTKIKSSKKYRTTTHSDDAVANENTVLQKASQTKRSNKNTVSGGKNTQTGLAATTRIKSKKGKKSKNTTPSTFDATPDSGIANQEQSNTTTLKNNAINTIPNTIDKQTIVKETPLAEKKLDSTPAMVEPNALEELLKQKNEKENQVAVTKLNRWQITSNVAPVYFSSTSNGSPIDQQFSGNEKSYENNLAYGVGVNYALNKKLSIRTGVNKVTLGYNTNDVVFFAGLQAQNLSNVSASANGSSLEVVNKDQVSSQGLLPFESSIQSNNTGAINQRIGYIEVPMEMSYKLIDSKFGVSVIGGLSTLFLNENQLTVVSPMMSATLGKANNLNDVHFSSNLGVGFKYSFWKAFEFNFEPMLKYQINTFSKDAGNFKPYFIGLYSGVSFSF